MFKINTKSIILYAVCVAAMVFMNAAVDGVPLSLGLYFAMLLNGTSLIVTPVLYMLASITHLKLITGLLSLYEGGFLCLVAFIYRKTGRKIRIEAAAYAAIALAPYVAFADWSGADGLNLLSNAYAMKAVAAVIIMLFCFFCSRAVYAVLYRAMRCRLREDELLCCAVAYAAFGVGFYRLAGFYAYTVFSAAALIYCVRLAADPAAVIAALVLAFPPAIATFSAEPLTAYVIAAAAAYLFVNAGRVAPSAVTMALTAAYLYLKGAFDCPIALIVLQALVLLCLCMLPAIPSAKYFEVLKAGLLVRERLPDTAVARSRRRTGEKLYRISEVFREIECAFNSLDEEVNDGATRARMLTELKEKCCKGCERAKVCAKTDVYSGFKKLIDSGCVKGKVNLIDLTEEVTSSCTSPAEVLSRLNAMLADYRRYMTEAENAKSGRILLADQAHGVAEVMKACAVELCKTHSEYTPLEESLKIKLSSHGISCPELYISGDDMEVSAIVCGGSGVKAMTEIISAELGQRYILKDKLSYDAEKSCLVFGAPPRLDAAFGVAYAIKSGEKVSGDTHSVIKINEHSFLMALSDGMGSGEYAKKVSSTAISLIEAFYRAEMPEGTVLKTINKLLSFNRDERFTCIDIAAVNLNTGMADFVKIGSPAGIIVHEGEIRILESRSLPLGILDNLRPTVCTEQLKSGDIVVFMSDGITSAFSSPTELYEFVQGLKPLNPQSLADKILAGAKARCSSVTDDMTVLCTRIFEK